MMIDKRTNNEKMKERLASKTLQNAQPLVDDCNLT